MSKTEGEGGRLISDMVNICDGNIIDIEKVFDVLDQIS